MKEVPIVFSFFARMNVNIHAVNHKVKSAYCFQFFRADEHNILDRICQVCKSAYCFQFFRADEHKSCLWNVGEILVPIVFSFFARMNINLEHSF